MSKDDPEIIALAESIKKFGLQEPLVITKDDWIVSGHRRRVAAWLAGLREVPCRRLNIKREGNPNFVLLLRECNRQRIKSRAEHLREVVLSVNSERAYDDLLEYREKSSRTKSDTIQLRDEKTRAELSKAKRPLLDAVQRIIERLFDFWPIER